MNHKKSGHLSGAVIIPAKKLPDRQDLSFTYLRPAKKNKKNTADTDLSGWSASHHHGLKINA